MNTVFTYGGNRKSAVTPRTILFGAYSDAYNYDALESCGQMPYTAAQVATLADLSILKSISAVTQRMSELDIAIAALQAFETKVGAYYSRRTNRMSSGGLQTRLFNEDKDLRSAVRERKQLLQSARVTAEGLAMAIAKAGQSNYNHATGTGLTPAELEAMLKAKLEREGATGQESFDFSTLIIPIGAGLAALYFLKGH